MGGAAKSVTNFAKSPTRVLSALGTSGASEAWRKTIPGLSGAQQSVDNWLGGNNQSNPYVSGPFSLDPYQLASDQRQINELGQKQFDQTNKFATDESALRATNREALSKALTQQASDSFSQMLPGTLEDLNSKHLLNGSGVGQELARQQGQLATNIANQVGVQGAQDLNYGSDIRRGALGGLQGSAQSSLQRQLGLEDFINQSNVAKAIGAQMAPPPPSGKAQFGTTAAGIGALGQGAGALMGK